LIELLDTDKLETLLAAQSSSNAGLEHSTATDEGSPQTHIGDAAPSHHGSSGIPWLAGGDGEALDSNGDGNFSQNGFLDQSFSTLDQAQGNMFPSNFTTMQTPSHQIQNATPQAFQLPDNATFEEILRNSAALINGSDSSMPDLFENFNQMISTPWQIPGENLSSPESWLAAAEEQSSFPLQVSPDIADHLLGSPQF
jgi:hypothetical protein